MLNKNEVKLMKLLVKFAQRNMSRGIVSFEDFSEKNLNEKEKFLLESNLKSLLEKMDSIESEIEEDEFKESERLKPIISKVVADMVKDGELKTAISSDYDSEYIVLEVNTQDDCVGPRYNWDNARIK